MSLGRSHYKDKRWKCEQMIQRGRSCGQELMGGWVTVNDIKTEGEGLSVNYWGGISSVVRWTVTERDRKVRLNTSTGLSEHIPALLLLWVPSDTNLQSFMRTGTHSHSSQFVKKLWIGYFPPTKLKTHNGRQQKVNMRRTIISSNIEAWIYVQQTIYISLVTVSL